MARVLPKLYRGIQDYILRHPERVQMECGASPKNWLKIRQAAAQLDIAVETIRMYEREGLLLPARTAKGQRLFNEDDLHWMGCIRRLIKERGLNLEGIRRLLALMPCWELKPCSAEERKNCPAYLGATKPCWMIKSELNSECRTAACRDCKVYQSALHCDNLKSLLYKQAERGHLAGFRP